ncbi:MAG: substrate-binding domain-containing protein [Pseudomonadota bacterium]
MRAASRVTIKDVADRAGCGIATASRVLNQSGPTSADARERVTQAASDLGFTFSAIGRALQSNRSMTIGCLVPSLVNPVFAEAVQGIQEHLFGSGYQLLIASSNYDGATDEKAVENLISNRVDGLIVTMIAPEKSEALAGASDRGLPVSLMFHDPLEGFVTAHIDNFEAARSVAGRFADLGHRRCGFLALRFSTSDRSRNRYAGFHAECRARGLGDPTLIELTEAEARDAAKLAEVLADHGDLTAIFASNDFLAIAVQRAAQSLGRRIPEDLSVVGFDGIDVGELLDPPLATVETHPQAIGRNAADALLSMLRGEAPTQRAPLPFSFREGATLGRPRARSRDDDRVANRPSSVPPLETKLNQG